MFNSVISKFKPSETVFAHCDLPCGVYDPAQAKIEAQSVKACMEKYAASSDADFKARAVSIKEERSELVKHHLWVLWTDYFKPNHFEAYPQLHSLFNEATKLAGAGGSTGSNDVAVAEKLIGKIDEIAEIFWATKK
jgi:nickel superoxide dismutase